MPRRAEPMKWGIAAAAGWLGMALLASACHAAQDTGSVARIVIADAEGPSVAVLPFDNHTKAKRLAEAVRAVVAAAIRAKGHRVYLPPAPQDQPQRPALNYPYVDVRPGAGGKWHLQGVSAYLDRIRVETRNRPWTKMCDYELRGSVSQFGDAFRIEAALKRRGSGADLTTPGATADREEDLIDAAQAVGQQAAKWLGARRLQDKIDAIVAGYRTRKTTFDVAVSDLQGLAQQSPFVVNLHLLTLYLERRAPTSQIVNAGRACIQAFDPHSEQHVRLIAALGVDPFLVTVDGLMAQRDYAEAVSVGLSALAVSPLQRPALQLRVGQALRSKGDASAAMACFAKVLQSDSANAEAHWQLAQLYETTGKVEKAVTHYRQAMRLAVDPKRKAAAAGRLRALEGGRAQ